MKDCYHLTSNEPTSSQKCISSGQLFRGVPPVTNFSEMHLQWHKNKPPVSARQAILSQQVCPTFFPSAEVAEGVPKSTLSHLTWGKKVRLICRQGWFCCCFFLLKINILNILLRNYVAYHHMNLLWNVTGILTVKVVQHRGNLQETYCTPYIPVI